MDTRKEIKKDTSACPCGRETCCPDCGLCEGNNELSVS